jgi:hypothetical protein
MDPDRQKLIDAEIKIIKQTSYSTPDDGNVFQSLRDGHPYLFSNEMDRFIHDYHINFLLPSGIVLFIIFLIA